MKATLQPRLLQTPRVVRNGFVCIQCQRRATLTLAPNPYCNHPSNLGFQDRNASSSSWSDSIAEKLRGKIWEGKPPGLVDPYSSRGAENQQKESAGVPEADRDGNPRDVIPENAAALSGPSDVREPDKRKYDPATTWEGLEWIGGQSGWWEADWDREHQFKRFINSTKLESRQDIARAIHRACVEVYALKDGGRSIDEAKYASDSLEDYLLAGATFRKDADGEVQLSFVDDSMREAILEQIPDSQGVFDQDFDEQSTEELVEGVEQEAHPTDADAHFEGQVRPEEAQSDIEEQQRTSEDQQDNVRLEEAVEEPAIVQDDHHNRVASKLPSQEGAGNNTWRAIEFTDPDLKFAILKRASQLTGARIPDPAISSIESTKALFGHLVKKEPPKKLAQVLSEDMKLKGLPNLKMMARRYTPVDKEKEVGRWKVIEGELRRRGLPVLGSEKYAENGTESRV